MNTSILEINRLNKILSDIDLGLVDKILSSVTRMEAVEALTIIGSIAKGLYVQGKSGIDLLLLKNKYVSESDVIEELSSNGFTFEKSDDIFLLKDTLISIHIQSYDYYIDYLSSVMNLSECEIRVKEWTIGGVCRDVILDDISKSIILYDKRERFSRFANKIGIKYCFGNEFRNILLYQLYTKINLTNKEFKEQNYFLFQIGFFECIEIVERIYCHDKKSYNKGFKHVVKEFDFLIDYKLMYLNNLQIDVGDMKKTLDLILKKYGGLYE